MTTPRLHPSGISIDVPVIAEYEQILTPEALAFLAELHQRFDLRRRELLASRAERQKRIDAGQLPDFLPETVDIRKGDWKVAPIPADLMDRRVEITGPVDRKMVINALNSGANVFMADFEDSNSPTWDNNLAGQINLRDAVRGDIAYASPEGKKYALNPKPAVLLVRPRGWHLEERHMQHRRPADFRLAVRFRPVLLSQRQGADGEGHRAVLLSAQDAEPSGSAPVERRLRVRAGTRRRSATAPSAPRC